MKNILAFIMTISSLLLFACQPSEQVIQTALAETQIAMPTQTVTPLPSPTVNPCTARGWEEIAIYLHQFDKEAKSVEAGMIIDTFLQQLENTKDKINDVAIDACSEYARQLIVSGLANEIIASEILLLEGDIEEGTRIMIMGIDMIKEAKAELKNHGINLKYP